MSDIRIAGWSARTRMLLRSGAEEARQSPRLTPIRLQG
jgi:hypothetical protein